MADQHLVVTIVIGIAPAVMLCDSRWTVNTHENGTSREMEPAITNILSRYAAF